MQAEMFCSLTRPPLGVMIVGIWIELGVFLLVFVFAAWQFHDLRREKAKRLAREAQARVAEPAPGGSPPAQSKPHPPEKSS
ncbi:MAG: hypothetical protein RL322_2096 [Pseudomonadota bacterium]